MLLCTSLVGHVVVDGWIKISYMVVFTFLTAKNFYECHGVEAPIKFLSLNIS